MGVIVPSLANVQYQSTASKFGRQRRKCNDGIRSPVKLPTLHVGNCSTRGLTRRHVKGRSNETAAAAATGRPNFVMVASF